LYPDQKPVLTFETGKNKIEGSTSCNSFTGAFTAGGKKIKIEGNLTLTKTACSGDGESVFLQALKKINGYDVTAGHLLTLTMDNVAMMRFTKVAESF
jgi:heat shock protein HslJ